VSNDSIPRFSISELNQAIANLLERGFAPRFLLDATVVKPQLKKGHLWMSLSDGSASIAAVIWASQLARISHRPNDGDGVVVVGKLNVWVARASLTVQVLDLRPSLSTVLRQFEQVSNRLQGEGLLDPSRKRPLPPLPRRVAVLTSEPSSALADLLRTAAERWPATDLLLVPIPVQGAVEARICQTLTELARRASDWGLDAVLLARGGGSREDLALFDSEAIARAVAACPLPVVSGIGHEDDTTVVDLVADHRAATPTAAMVALLPDRHSALAQQQQRRLHLSQQLVWRLRITRTQLNQRRTELEPLHPLRLLTRRREELQRWQHLLTLLSPQHWLERGFVLLRNRNDRLITTISEVELGEEVNLELADGKLSAQITGAAPRDATTQAQQH
jgi:exodeoxyribonuclease VII large subunit